MERLRTSLFIAYFVLMIIIVGGTIFATMVEYPNWFANVPSSLAATRNFYQVLHPGHFFQTFAPLFLLVTIAFLVVGWRSTTVRNVVLISFVLMLAAELLTFLYIYPRLNILFAPETAGHTVDVLRQTANEFTLADRIRTILGFLAGGAGVAALPRFFKDRLA
jgi:hypothetical protein